MLHAGYSKSGTESITACHMRNGSYSRAAQPCSHDHLHLKYLCLDIQANGKKINKVHLPNERASRVYHHRQTQLALDKHVSDSASSHTQESTAGDPVEETGDEHGLYVLGDGAWYDPY